eukprot:TRINITY_DN103417_c0_g1_i1.p1 TRINITY_DN103417_c0_g1~~TRINITY_DN103417_c0_g1_i1.p1  ORF type:complete len:448 (+),score=66.48 TRINITY_DN103417_c0_g1_i1:93-1436(+)
MATSPRLYRRGHVHSNGPEEDGVPDPDKDSSTKSKVLANSQFRRSLCFHSVVVCIFLCLAVVASTILLVQLVWGGGANTSYMKRSLVAHEGAHVAEYHGIDLETCKLQCDEAQETIWQRACLSFTFSPSLHSCFLKSKKIGDSDPARQGGFLDFQTYYKLDAQEQANPWHPNRASWIPWEQQKAAWIQQDRRGAHYKSKCVSDEHVGSSLDWPIFLNRHERSMLSQNGEDGILAFIFSNIGVTDQFYVEFGVESGMERNTRYLQERCGWHGVLMDGGYANPAINLTKVFITTGNIGELLKERKVPSSFDLLSIDLDSTDLWIWRVLASKHSYKPRVVVVEFNSNYAIDEYWTNPDDPNVSWKPEEDCLFGASLAALNLLSKELGYSLVGVDMSSTNAFFVREDVLHAHGRVTVPSLSALHPAPYPFHHPCSEARLRLRVDYKNMLGQ